MIRKIIIIALLITIVGHAHLFAFSSYQEIQDYYADGFAQKGIPIIRNKGVDIDIKKYIQPDLTQTNRDIGYRISLLPSEYQDQDEYFIFPKAGVVVPIIEVTPEERKVMNAGGQIDYLHYFQQGALHHRGKNPSVGPGNFTIAGHTSYYHNDPGDFKTNMQGLLLADPGDTLLYIQKESVDTFHRYVYEVNKSYETSKADVSILLPSTPHTYELTAYGCSPIGTTEKRWVVKASLVSDASISVSLDGTHAAADNMDDSHGIDDTFTDFSFQSLLGYIAEDFLNRGTSVVDAGMYIWNHSKNVLQGLANIPISPLVVYLAFMFV